MIYFGAFGRDSFGRIRQRDEQFATRLARHFDFVYVERTPKTPMRFVLALLFRTRGRLLVSREDVKMLFPLAFNNANWSVAYGGHPDEGLMRQLTHWMSLQERNELPLVWVQWPSSYARGVVESQDSFLVYDCMGKFAEREFPSGIRENDRWLQDRADILLTDSPVTCRLLESQGLRPHFVPQGVEQSWVRTGVEAVHDVVNRRPRIGYIGSFHGVFDINLVAQVASLCPDYDFELVGPPTAAAIEALSRVPNVSFLGHVAFDHLPTLLESFDAGIIPYTVNDLSESVYPTKLFEYLAFGLGVVSTRLPSLAGFGDSIIFADSAQCFAAACRTAVAQRRDPELTQHRVLQARDNTWERRIATILEILEINGVSTTRSAASDASGDTPTTE